MLNVDLHSHTLHSACGNHTIIELLTHAKSKGVQYLAITDHGPALGRKITSTFYERFKNPVEGITLLKGMECNIQNERGEIDLPEEFYPYMDVVLLGLHHNTPLHQSESFYTELMLKALDRHPEIDILTHLNDPKFPVDFRAVITAAKSKGVLIELNNSKLMYGHVTKEATERLLEAAKLLNAEIVINSDSHSLHEVGEEGEAMAYVERLAFPKSLIKNRSSDQIIPYLASRRRTFTGNR